MRETARGMLVCLAVLGLGLPASAQEINVDCGAGDDLATSVFKARSRLVPDATGRTRLDINVQGTCLISDPIEIFGVDEVTLIGVGGASDQGAVLEGEGDGAFLLRLLDVDTVLVSNVDLINNGTVGDGLVIEGGNFVEIDSTFFINFFGAGARVTKTSPAFFDGCLFLDNTIGIQAEDSTVQIGELGLVDFDSLFGSGVDAADSILNFFDASFATFGISTIDSSLELFGPVTMTGGADVLLLRSNLTLGENSLLDLADLLDPPDPAELLANDSYIQMLLFGAGALPVISGGVQLFPDAHLLLFDGSVDGDVLVFGFSTMETFGGTQVTGLVECDLGGDAFIWPGTATSVGCATSTAARADSAVSDAGRLEILRKALARSSQRVERRTGRVQQGPREFRRPDEEPEENARAVERNGRRPARRPAAAPRLPRGRR